MENFTQSLISLLTPVLLALISLGCAYLIKYVNIAKNKVLAETEKIQNEKQQVLVNGAINQLDSLLKQNISYAEQTLVKEIKLATEDNKLTVEEGKEVAQTVVNMVMEQLTDDSKEYLSTQSKNLQQYVLGELQVIFDKIKAENQN